MNTVNRIRVGIVLLGFLISFFIGKEVFTQKKLMVSFLDIGQGDSIFIEAPNGNQILLDGGPDRSVLRELSKEIGFFDRFIDVVIASHPDQDHIGGLPLVLRRYGAGVFLEPGVSSDTGTYTNLKQELSVKNIPVIVARKGMVIDLGSNVLFEIFFPDRDVSNLETNTASIVGKLSYGSTSVMLTGDSPLAIERYLTGIFKGALKSDVLKAGHHGSKTSSSEEFVSIVSPKMAVISSGKDNRYGHPHREVLAVFEKLHVPYLNTAEVGGVRCISDGYSIRCK